MVIKPEKETAQATMESEAPKATSEAKVAADASQEDAAAGSETPATAIAKHEIDAIIRKRVYAAMAVGLAPIPLVDLAGITAIQIEMVHALAKKYGVPFKADAVKTIISSLVGGIMPVAFAPAVASLVKFIPIIGWTTAGVSLSLTAGATTYAVGNVFVVHFESGGVLLDFDVNKVRGVFKSKVDEGKTVVSKMKQEQQAGS
jgi:uncharacterized protein (DUF697 family)